MTDLPLHRFTASDGAEIVWREMGEGRPVVMIHGFFPMPRPTGSNTAMPPRLLRAGFA